MGPTFLCRRCGVGPMEQWLRVRVPGGLRGDIDTTLIFAREQDDKLAELHKSNLMWFEEAKKLAAQLEQQDGIQRQLVETLVLILHDYASCEEEPICNGNPHHETKCEIGIARAALARVRKEEAALELASTSHYGLEMRTDAL